MASNAKQHQESSLQGLIPTLLIMLQSNLRPITHLKFNKSRDSPTPTQKDPITTLEHHPFHMLSYLTFTKDLDKASLFVAKHHCHFPKRAQLKRSKFLTHKPHEEIRAQILDKLTGWNLNSSIGCVEFF
jgi:hypothetical protein